MITSKKIVKYLESGFFVEAKDPFEHYMIFYPFKDENGDYMEGQYNNSSEEARRSPTENFNGEIEKRGENPGWEITDVFLQPFKPYEIGQKVKAKLFSGIKEISNVGMDGHYGISGADVSYFHFELEPVFDDKPPKKDWNVPLEVVQILGVSNINKLNSKGFKIVKINDTHE